MTIDLERLDAYADEARAMAGVDVMPVYAEDMQELLAAYAERGRDACDFDYPPGTAPCMCRFSATGDSAEPLTECYYHKRRTAERDRLAAELTEARRLLDSRAGRLLQRGVPFFVVKASEPYAPRVVDLIKAHEGLDWTADDEAWAQAALSGTEGSANGSADRETAP